MAEDGGRACFFFRQYSPPGATVGRCGQYWQRVGAAAVRGVRTDFAPAKGMGQALHWQLDPDTRAPPRHLTRCNEFSLTTQIPWKRVRAVLLDPASRQVNLRGEHVYLPQRISASTVALAMFIIAILPQLHYDQASLHPRSSCSQKK